MKNRFAAVVAAAAVLAWMPAQAATPPQKKPVDKPDMKVETPTGSGAVGKGDFELSAFANVNSTDGETFTFLGSSIGYFMTDEVQILAGAFGFLATDLSDFSFQIGANYHFPAWQPQGVSNPMVPYAGASLALSVSEFADTSETNVDPAVRVGIKQFLGERISVGYELEHTLSDPASTELKLGLNFYF